MEDRRAKVGKLLENRMEIIIGFYHPVYNSEPSKYIYTLLIAALSCA